MGCVSRRRRRKEGMAHAYMYIHMMCVMYDIRKGTHWAIHWTDH